MLFLKSFLLSLILIHTNAFSQPLVIKAGQVEFSAKAANSFAKFLEIEAHGGRVVDSNLVRKKHIISGTVTVDLTGFVTGMDTRDEHLHDDYLESSRYKTAVLTIDAADVKFGAFKGKLKIKENVAPIDGRFVLDGKGLMGQFEVKLKNYPSLGVPEYAGFALKDVITVSFISELE